MTKPANQLKPGDVLLRCGVRCIVSSAEMGASPNPHFSGQVVRVQHHAEGDASKLATLSYTPETIVEVAS